MAIKCGHYEHLGRRFQNLCTKFLDPEIAAESADPAGYNPDLDFLAAFRLLFHAEVETFLEEKAKEKLSQLEVDIKSGAWHGANPQLLSLYLVLKNYVQETEDLGDIDLRKHFVKIIGSARSRVKENNGIKSQSFLFLSVAAGKSLDCIDVALSSTLNSYGKDRGEVAHGSAARSHSLTAPSTEKATGKNIVSELATYFDVFY